MDKDWLHTVQYLPLFNLHEKQIMQNAKINESKAGIKTAGGKINNLSYTDNNTDGINWKKI